MKNQNLMKIGLIFGVLGIVFALLPHQVHMGLLGHEGMNMHSNHGMYATWGWIIGIIGLAVAFTGWKLWD